MITAQPRCQACTVERLDTILKKGKSTMLKIVKTKKLQVALKLVKFPRGVFNFRPDMNCPHQKLNYHNGDSGK